MSSLILHLDLNSPLPEQVPLEGHDSLLLILWQAGRPFSMVTLPGNDGMALVSRTVAHLADSATGPSFSTPPGRPLPSLTLAVCTRDRARLLAHCLKGISRQNLFSAEVLVIDNAPGDDSTRKVVTGLPWCRYVREDRPGIARARNRALREARGEVIAYIDDDCIPFPAWSRHIADWFARRRDLGCVTGPVLPLELRTRAQQLLEDRGGYTRGFSTRIFHRDSGHPHPVFPVQAWMFGTGANMAFSRDHLRRLGGFDERVQAEDLDIFYRILSSGRTLIYEPGATVMHRHPRDLAAVRRSLRGWGQGYAEFLCKIISSCPRDRSKALRELRNWLFGYQFKALLLGKSGRGSFPRGLIMQEILGCGLAFRQILFRKE